jgi:hypothetical protein
VSSRRRPSTARLAPVAVLLVLAGSTAAWSPVVGASTTGSAAAAAATPQRWMRTVCTALGDFNSATDTSAMKVGTTLGDLAAAKTTVKKAKASLLKAYADATAAADKLIAKVRGVGTPSIPNAGTVTSSFQGVVKDTRAAYATAQRSYGKLKTLDPAQFQQSAKAIEDTEKKALNAAGDPLEGLRAVPQLADVIKTDDACTALAPLFTPTTLKAGDCVTSPTSTNPDLDQLTPAPCATPHLAEVIAVTTYAAGPNDAYPGPTTLDRAAGTQCQDAFMGYVGIDYNASNIDLSYYYPGKDTWPGGDREIVCVADHKDGSTLTGSVKGVAH